MMLCRDDGQGKERDGAGVDVFVRSGEAMRRASQMSKRELLKKIVENGAAGGYAFNRKKTHLKGSEALHARVEKEGENT